MIRHLALIPDGNRRWARKHRLPTFKGHEKGFERAKAIIDRSRELGIRVFTVWAFSTENWSRSKSEVAYLMKIYEKWINENLPESIKTQTRIIHIGRKDRIPKSLSEKIKEAELKTEKFRQHFFIIALDYGGRDEILRATKKAENQKLNEEKLSRLLDTKNVPYPDPDLVIRTSGETRTSGFMIWQTAYSEWIFYPKFLPEFTTKDLDKCLKMHSQRQRRFGK